MNNIDRVNAGKANVADTVTREVIRSIQEPIREAILAALDGRDQAWARVIIALDDENTDRSNSAKFRDLVHAARAILKEAEQRS